MNTASLGFWSLLAGCLLSACHDVESRGGEGATCQAESDCREPYVCRLGSCRSECDVDRDCPDGACLVLDEQTRICTTTSEESCDPKTNEPCQSGFVCEQEHVCRNASLEGPGSGGRGGGGSGGAGGAHDEHLGGVGGSDDHPAAGAGGVGSSGGKPSGGGSGGTSATGGKGGPSSEGGEGGEGGEGAPCDGPVCRGCSLGLPGPPQLQVGSHPTDVVAGDFNEDGIVDFAVTNEDSNSVSVFPNRGDATFGARVDYAVGRSPESIAASDLNVDGHLDLLIGNMESPDVSILMGRGDGTFAMGASYSAGIGAISIAAADFNADNKPDLAVALNDPFGSRQYVLVAWNQGDGTFANGQYIAGDYTRPPWALVTGDFNGDGLPDFAYTTFLAKMVGVVLNAGQGTFGPELYYPSQGEATGMTAADLDGDGALDLALSNYHDEAVGVLLNHGDGTFKDVVRYPVIGSGSSAAAADLNHDGHVDLISVGAWFPSPAGVNVLFNAGDGTFGNARLYAAGPDTYGVTVADLNGDNAPDVVSTTFVGDAANILLNEGDGKFLGVSVSGFAETGPDIVAVADVNDDERADVLVADATQGTLGVRLNLGNGTLAAAQDYQAGTSPSDLIVAPLNADNLPDAAVVNLGVGVGVLLNEGGGAFPNRTSYPVTGARLVVAGDFDHDDARDLAVVGDSGTSILLNHGNGTFFGQPAQLATGTEPTAAAAADLDGDTVADLAVASGDGTIKVLLNDGAGSFAVPRVYGEKLSALGLVLADLNGDGALDLAATNNATDALIVLLNDGSGAFSAADPLTTADGPAAIVAGDVNGDGTVDLVVANLSGASVSVFFNHGDATFAPSSYASLLTPNALAMADLNSDGRLDLVAADLRNSDIGLFFNACLP